MAFKGMFYHNQHSTSESWRLATRRFFGNQDGRLYGVPVTSSGNNVSVGTGYFIVCGGVVQITSAEVLASGASGTKTLCFQIDLGQSNEVDVFNQGSFVWITGNPTQQDLWSTGGTLYQMPIATVVTNGTNITSLTVLLKDIDGDILGYLNTINTKLSGYDNAFSVSGANVDFLGLVKQNGVNVVESGSNANGQWIKFSDGTLIQNSLYSLNLALGANVYTPAFPVPFANVNYRIITTNCDTGRGIISNARASSVSNFTGQSFWNNTGGHVDNTYLNLYAIAIGKWR